MARRDYPAWPDAALLEVAESEARILVTIDKDFWQIAMQRRVPITLSGVVLFRVHPATPGNLRPIAQAFLDARRDWVGHVSIISSSGIHVLPIRIH